MADLIIQPKNDDHLKLNNDAGTTILELANDESKLRLAQNNISASNGTTAITTSGANVTLAGTSNNIGTVTSGTFNSTIGTSATFPAGCVIQTVFNSTTTGTSISSTTSGSGSTTGLSATITAKSTSNKFLINYVGALIMDTAAAPAVSVEIFDGSSVVAQDTFWGWRMNSDGNEVDNQYRYPFMCFVTPSSSSALTYTVRAFKLQPQAVTFNNDSKPSTICIQEIQQ
tara:strand:+ start:376 stop:1059 length:684 start_codon:yes stop_codon:yes gene_type:complete